MLQVNSSLEDVGIEEGKGTSSGFVESIGGEEDMVTVGSAGIVEGGSLCSFFGKISANEKSVSATFSDSSDDATGVLVSSSDDLVELGTGGFGNSAEDERFNLGTVGGEIFYKFIIRVSLHIKEYLRSKCLVFSSSIIFQCSQEIRFTS